MKSLKIFLFLFIGILLSCNSEETIEKNDFFTIAPLDLTLNIDAESNDKFYTVKSDKTLQVSSSDPDWCKALLSNVSIDNLKIAISENPSFLARKAVVTISNGLDSKDITINQAGVQTELSVDKNSVFIQFGKPEFNLEITSNTPFDFELPEWIKGDESNSWEKGKKKYFFQLLDLPDELFYREGAVIIKPIDHSNANYLSVSITQKAITKVVAHRGFWMAPAYPQNSIASLQRAIDLDIYGSELDVWITKDGIVLLNHDATIDGINIENSTLSQLNSVRLSNGEPLPTLQQCIDLLKNGGKTKLVIEIKPHSSTVNENRAVAAVLDLVNSNGVSDMVDYISFSQNICQELIKANSQNRVAYLNGNLAPEILNEQGYWGLDYNLGVLKANTGWVQYAQNLGLTSNVWTVNSTDDFSYFIAMGVDLITTDYPQVLKELLASRE